jgi:adenine-specific DNA-methyltransferase
MQKLELTWIGKGEEPAVEPRILLHDASKDYGDPNAANMLIHGDNLLALKALEQEFAGRVKCIYIDPPYNTGSAFEQYNDNLEHSTWLNLILPRLRILRELLSDDGSIWINLDDNEVHYCKVVLDELFGRSNFLCDIAWEKRYSPPPDTKDFGYVHDHILVYRKTRNFQRNLLPLTEDQTGRYKNPDDDPRGAWKSTDYTCRFTREQRPNLYYPIKQPNTGEMIYPNDTRVWAFSKEVHEQNEQNNKIWWGVKGTNKVPALKNFLSEINQGMMPMSLWKYTMVGHTQEAMKEQMALFGKNPFATPKPERLIQHVLMIGSNPGDIVLDSFLGSGTTAAVAHKMDRRYIGIELGDHCYTHCLPRLQMVVDGEQGGISKSVNWHGGGGFKFYELAPTLIVKDQHGQPVISEKYNAQMLVAAIAKLNGYAYAPDADVFWKQGFSQAGSYIYVTSEYLTAAQLDAISGDLQAYERLLICAPAFDVGLGRRYENINVRKIPQSVLSKCEYGADDYNLNIVTPPELNEDEWEDCEDA